MGKRIYKDFDGPQNWELFPEVVSTLKRIKAAGAILGVISNFDERLSEALELILHLGLVANNKCYTANGMIFSGLQVAF